MLDQVCCLWRLITRTECLWSSAILRPFAGILKASSSSSSSSSDAFNRQQTTQSHPLIKGILKSNSSQQIEIKGILKQPDKTTPGGADRKFSPPGILKKETVAAMATNNDLNKETGDEESQTTQQRKETTEIGGREEGRRGGGGHDEKPDRQESVLVCQEKAAENAHFDEKSSSSSSSSSLDCGLKIKNEAIARRRQQLLRQNRWWKSLQFLCICGFQIWIIINYSCAVRSSLVVSNLICLLICLNMLLSKPPIRFYEQNILWK